MINKKNVLLSLILILGVLFVAACNSTGPINQVVDSSSDAPSLSTGDTKEISVKAFRFGFEPNTITVNKGDRVKITAESIDVAHGFAISEFGVDSRLNPGKSTMIEFVADKEGTFIIYCSVPCGLGHGSMRGRLIVE